MWSLNHHSCLYVLSIHTRKETKFPVQIKIKCKKNVIMLLPSLILCFWQHMFPYPCIVSILSLSFFPSLRHQIIMAKRLVEEGTKAWKLISQNNHQVQWESVVFEIEEQFMKIASCSSRSLTQQVFLYS